IAIDSHHFVEAVRGQALADGDEPPVNRSLLLTEIGNGRAGHRVLPRARPQPSALERVDVEVIDNQDVIKSFLQAWKEARALRLELGLRGIFDSNRPISRRPCL